jgi:hypothetical protein
MIEQNNNSNNLTQRAGSEIPIDTKDVFGKYIEYMKGRQSVNKYQQNKRMKEDNIWANEVKVNNNVCEDHVDFLPNRQHFPKRS